MNLIKWIALGVLAAMVLLFMFFPVVAWIIIGLLLLVILLVLFVPVGADVAYVDGEFSLAARVNGFAIRLLPRKPEDPNKPKKKKKEKKPKEPEEEKPPQEDKPKEEKKGGFKLDFTLEEIVELIKKVIHGLGKFGKITVRHFMLHYIAAGDDPYQTAVTFNYVNAALSTLAPVCAQKFRITGDVDVWTDIDFARDKMKVDAALSATLRIAQFVHVGLAVGFGVLGILIKNRLRLRREAREEKKRQRRETAGVAEPELDNQKMIKAEERKETHG